MPGGHRDGLPGRRAGVTARARRRRAGPILRSAGENGTYSRLEIVPIPLFSSVVQVIQDILAPAPLLDVGHSATVTARSESAEMAEDDDGISLLTVILEDRIDRDEAAIILRQFGHQHKNLKQYLQSHLSVFQNSILLSVQVQKISCLIPCLVFSSILQSCPGRY